MKILTALLFLVSTAQAGLLPSPTPPLTPDQKSVAEIQSAAQAGFQVLGASLVRSFNQVCNNPFGLSPAQIVSDLGTNACQAHQLFVAGSALLNAAQPGSFTITEPCVVSCNSDGSATIGACPSPSPSPSVSP